jgi:hypothetical protein
LQNAGKAVVRGKNLNGDFQALGGVRISDSLGRDHIGNRLIGRNELDADFEARVEAKFVKQADEQPLDQGMQLVAAAF